MIEPKFAALLWGLCTIYWRQALSNRAEKIYEQVLYFVPPAFVRVFINCCLDLHGAGAIGVLLI